jgi:type 1 glutamine amidotransferase
MVKHHYALLVGSREGAEWHPLDGVDSELSAILGGICELEVTTDRDRLAALEEGRFELLIAYDDAWKSALTDAQMAHVIRFVAGGGGILVLHNGISWQKRPEFQALTGAKFTGHPPFTKLAFRLSAPEHPLCDDLVANWSIDEEPYRFAPSADSEATVLYEYEHEGAWHPAAWATDFCRGRVVYLMPGHTVESFRHPEYRLLIRAAATWLLRVR